MKAIQRRNNQMVEATIEGNGPPRRLVYRHRLATRLWHWFNVVVVFVMIMSGLMIFNAHPRLYWGKYGANTDHAWLQIGAIGERGLVQLGPIQIPTTGVLGRYTDGQGRPQNHAFPGWATIPSYYSLADARQWHLFFSWLLVIGGLGYWAISFANRHVVGDLLPTRAELSPRHIWRDIKDHARLRLPTGEAAASYNVLQKLSYVGVLFGLLPLLVLTGLGMSPGMNAAWPFLLDVFGGRQSARSIHFLCMGGVVAFIIVHVVMVVLAGPFNEIRSMITGRYRLPAARHGEEPR
jgi:thiosulfate reductase cytochrome b subunit